MMLKFINSLTLLAIILLFIIFALNYAIGNRNKEPAHYKLQYEELVNSSSSNNNSYIILGTSHATHGIRPSYLALPMISGYNFALNGSNPEFYFKWYNEIFKNTYPKPEYIIFCIDWFLFDEKWLWRRYEQDSQYFPLNIFINNLLRIREFDTRTLMLNRFPFTKHKNISDLFHLITNEPDNTFPIDEYDKGFIPYETGNPVSIKKSKEKISLKQKIFFEKLIKLLVNDGIKVIFVSIPEYGSIDFYNGLKSINIFKNIASKYNIPILNYNTDNRTKFNRQKEYYSDWGHLNRKGSIEFSKLLSIDVQNILRKNKSIVTKR